MKEIIRRETGFWKGLDWDTLTIHHRYGQHTRLAVEQFNTADEMQARVDYFMQLDPPFRRGE